MPTEQNCRLRHFVEEVGLFFEESGMPRMTGRIVGWLLVCEPPEQTSGELAGGLLASKGSVSTSTRMLIQAGLIERVATPGKRGHSFRIVPHAWTRLMEAKLAGVTMMRELADKGLELLADRPPQVQERLREFRDFYAFFETEFPMLIEHWLTAQTSKDET
jgi:DNA-binding transcriptional regulator GbsR (MarR family)